MSAKTQNIKGNDPVSSKESFKFKDIVLCFILYSQLLPEKMSQFYIKQKNTLLGQFGYIPF